MLDVTLSEIVNYRLGLAHEYLDAAIREKNSGDFKSAANCSYYCVFHAMRAVLALEELNPNDHSEVRKSFQQNYLNTEMFPAIFADIIRNAYDTQYKSDYEDFYAIKKQDAIGLIENATVFLTTAGTYIKTINLDN